MLRIVDWHLVTDVSRKYIGPTERIELGQYKTNRLSRNVSNYQATCVTPKKSEDVLTVVEVSNDASSGLISYITSAKIRDRFRTKCKYKSDPHTN
jgi:hypothetical protein